MRDRWILHWDEGLLLVSGWVELMERWRWGWKEGIKGAMVRGVTGKVFGVDMTRGSV